MGTGSIDTVPVNGKNVRSLFVCGKARDVCSCSAIPSALTAQGNVRMLEHVRLTQQEQARLQVLNNLLAGYMTTEQAATLMGLSTRHTRRMLAAYRQEGAAVDVLEGLDDSLAVQHEGRDIPSQEAPPRPSVLRGFGRRTTHSPIVHDPINGLGSKCMARLAALDADHDA